MFFKKLYCLLILFQLFYGFCFSFENKRTVLSGKIIGNTSPILYLAIDNIYDMNYKHIIIDSTKKNSNNYFRFDILLDSAGFYYLDDDNGNSISVFIEPNDSLFVNLNYKKELLTFNGIGKINNNYFSESYEEFKKDEEFYKKILKMKIMELFKFHDDIVNEKLKFFNEYFNGININPKLKKEVNLQILYGTATDIIYFATELQIRKLDTIDFKIFIKNLNDRFRLVNQNAIKSRSYRIYLANYLSLLFLEWKTPQISNGIKLDGPSISKKFFEIAKSDFDEQIRDIAISHAIKTILSENSDHVILNLSKDFIKEFGNIALDSNYLTPLLNQYNSKMLLSEGSNAIDFSVKDIHGTIIKLFELRGKVVYLDFWGTWCRPCIQELPYSKKLISEFKNKDIVFVFLAMENNNYNNWEKYVKKNKLGGIQIYLESGWSNPICKKYLINSAPIYILIDKKGDIFSSNAKRPSNPKLKKDIQKLLNE